MESLQSELASIESTLTDQSLYEDSAKDRLTEILQQQGQLKTELEQTEEQWFEIQQQLAEHTQSA